MLPHLETFPLLEEFRDIPTVDGVGDVVDDVDDVETIMISTVDDVGDVVDDVDVDGVVADVEVLIIGRTCKGRTPLQEAPPSTMSLTTTTTSTKTTTTSKYEHDNH